ncbi:carboxylating nicotinate-nucleotide diphosphorylase [Psychrobium sp. MM17-31]|uniref:carboxylating nicotinate-nucleotide diphosphorylase n=1 Tax=Psychrobium sp. MM17-31 TaxID=2917758 RepID=UPI001EF47D48|nr:carboxylating nicotinate-nucleotide diphosphorylase [Psychrobium sp. MM17-31]MCG7533251.1 carboxylating nicotinate-nucleotide diphosphorylase [Psychrobium sp. MM17-31]
MNQQEIELAVTQALNEDLGNLNYTEGDITANLIPEDSQSQATIITRDEAIFCGKAWADEVFKQLGDCVTIDWIVEDGDKVTQNQVLCKLSGPTRVLLTGERSALNFIQMLSGTATTANKYVELIKHTNTKLLDTRKTIPGQRNAQKYAVTCGGGNNHRIGLFDAYLIKENHIMGCGGIDNAIKQARDLYPIKTVEVEVETLDELQVALAAGADIIMIDNFTVDMMKQAVEITDGRAKLEVSGNVNDNTIATYAETGVDYVSVGALTKHVQAIDLSMRLVK